MAGALSGLLLLPGQAGATELKPEAVRGFDTYVQRAEQRMQSEIRSGSPFLWIDSLPEAERRDVESRLQQGEVVTERLEDKDASEGTHTPGAKIHHWMGTAFIPGATLKQVLFLAQDYDEQQKYFQPQVMKSKLVSRNGDDFKIYLRLKQVKIITVIFDTDHDVHYVHLDTARAYSISRTTRVVEVGHPGEPNESSLPEGNDHGFLWRLNSYWRFSETPRGVYVQCEAISLSRDIPFGLSFIIGRFVEGIARESLEFTLQSTRTAAMDERFRAIRSANPFEGGAMKTRKNNPAYRDATRLQDSFTARAERKVLAWLAVRLPAWVNSDHLTLLGFASMFFAGASYAVAPWHPSALLLAVVFLVLNWFGDSLDGTLARVRNRQRPRYGFYVDHMIDTFGGLFLMGGLGLSGFLDGRIAAGMFVTFLMLSIESYLAAHTVGIFRLSYGKFGPTEIRILLSLGSVALWQNPNARVFGSAYRLFDVGGCIAIAGMALMLIVSAISHTLRLYREEARP